MRGIPLVSKKSQKKSVRKSTIDAQVHGDKSSVASRTKQRKGYTDIIKERVKSGEDKKKRARPKKTKSGPTPKRTINTNKKSNKKNTS